VLGVSLDAIALAGQDGYLRCAGRGCNGRSPELIGFMAAASAPAASSVASGSEAEVVPWSERMRGYRHAAGVSSLSAGCYGEACGGCCRPRGSAADAANLPPTPGDRAGERRRSMPTHRHQQFVAFGLNALAATAMQGSGLTDGIALDRDARRVIR
jgi:hypothetical protein